MIPKKIHYCWFGGNPLPELACKCIESWRKYCPDYTIIRWDESNYDFSAVPLYVRQAFEAKKWAFVTDYVRLQVVFEQGGVYMDTDVELLKPIDHLLEHQAYFGFETSREVNTGIGFGAEPGARILREIMDDYQQIPFVLPDGSFDRTPCPERNTQAFVRMGLKQDGSIQVLPDDVLILSTEYLCPMDSVTKNMTITDRTLSIHHYDASWLTPEERLFADYRRSLMRFLPQTVSGYIARGAAAVKVRGVSGLVDRVRRFVRNRTNRA